MVVPRGIYSKDGKKLLVSSRMECFYLDTNLSEEN
eukprot:CAMPEP_0116878666 /NCGR_PEP_ID=MMETSP0463-20121206/10416_1 /TAXON_ID=181622 /ORGANISM="Strombidinopsis sp, Strain SopsisLIS2011" /LENGTH=34 /DNA_ID= /DNA_START= /DNA_END= /DNA_ORIENTATION=